LLGALWRRWLKLAEIFGNVQMIVILSLLYWTLFLFIALPFKILAKPLTPRRREDVRWIIRDPESNPARSMRDQG
jgi:hypothetical protein